MNPIIIASAVIAAIGLLGAVLLVTASKLFAVTEDERIREVELALPGANCGSCGYAGCAAYAKAIVEGAPVNQCFAGGAAAAEKIAAIMGVEAGDATEYKAMVACRGDLSHTKKRYEYHGIPTCAACNVLYNGDSSCPFGCLGFGDCVKACKFGAIEIRDGIAHVNKEKCTGCGQCVANCPGLAIVIVNKAYSETEATVEFPFEYLPLPEKGSEVDAVNRAGETVCRGTVLAVTKLPAYAGTAVVRLAVPLELADEVRSMKRLPRTGLKKGPEPWVRERPEKEV